MLDEFRTAVRGRNEHNRRTGNWSKYSCVLVIVFVYTNGRTVQGYESLVCQVNLIVIHYERFKVKATYFDAALVHGNSLKCLHEYLKNCGGLLEILQILKYTCLDGGGTCPLDGISWGHVLQLCVK